MKKAKQINQELAPLRVTLVTDTHLPRKNGLSAPVSRMVQDLKTRELDIHLIRPRYHRQNTEDEALGYTETLLSGIPVPGYPGLKSGLPAKGKLLRMWRLNRPDIVHIATEGLLGWSALAAAKEMHIPVSTDIHSHFHRASRHRDAGLIQQTVENYLRHFHNRAACTLVHKETLQTELSNAGYQNVRVAPGSLDEEFFHPTRRRIQSESA